MIIENNNKKIKSCICDVSEIIQRPKLPVKGLLQYFALKETFPITRRANTNVGTGASLYGQIQKELGWA